MEPTTTREPPGVEPRKERTPFERFTAFARAIVAVPKVEIDAQERKYQRCRARRKTRHKT